MDFFRQCLRKQRILHPAAGASICAQIGKGFVRRSDQYLCAAIQLKAIQPGRTNPALPGNQRRRKERVGTMQVSGFVRRLDQLLHCSVDRAASSAMWVPGGTRVRYGMLRCGPVQVQVYIVQGLTQDHSYRFSVLFIFGFCQQQLAVRVTIWGPHINIKDKATNKTKDIFTLLRLKRFLYMIVGCSIPCKVVFAACCACRKLD